MSRTARRQGRRSLPSGRGAGGVGKDTRHEGCVAGAVLGQVDLAFAGVVEDRVDVVIGVHDCDGEVAAAAVGDGDDGSGEIHDGEAVEGVAVHPHDGLLVQWGGDPDAVEAG